MIIRPDIKIQSLYNPVRENVACTTLDVKVTSRGLSCVTTNMDGQGLSLIVIGPMLLINLVLVPCQPISDCL